MARGGRREGQKRSDRSEEFALRLYLSEYGLFALEPLGTGIQAGARQQEERGKDLDKEHRFDCASENLFDRQGHIENGDQGRCHGKC